LSYPAVMKRIKPTYCVSVLRVRFAVGNCFSHHCRSRGRGPGWFASSWANRLNTDEIIETMLSGLSGTEPDKYRLDGGNPKGLA